MKNHHTGEGQAKKSVVQSLGIKLAAETQYANRYDTNIERAICTMSCFLLATVSPRNESPRLIRYNKLSHSWPDPNVDIQDGCPNENHSQPPERICSDDSNVAAKEDICGLK